MQLQQLRYFLAAAESGSFRAASQKLYVSQSSLSVAVKELEDEMGVNAFNRTSRGISLTPAGAELLDYARRVIDQADLMAERYARGNGKERLRFAVSSQHYSLVEEAFGDFIAAHQGGPCELVLRETHANEVIHDTQDGRSDLGILYLSNYNDRVIGRALNEAGLVFSSLFVAIPHAVVRAGHPLDTGNPAKLDELDAFFRLEHEQGIESSSYYAEEPLAGIPHSRRVVVSDTATLYQLLGQTDGYALSTGVLPPWGDLVAVPLQTDEAMNVGLIRRKDAREGDLAREFLVRLARRIRCADAPIEASSLVYDLTREEGGAPAR